MFLIRDILISRDLTDINHINFILFTRMSIYLSMP